MAKADGWRECFKCLGLFSVDNEGPWAAGGQHFSGDPSGTRSRMDTEGGDIWIKTCVRRNHDGERRPPGCGASSTQRLSHWQQQSPQPSSSNC